MPKMHIRTICPGVCSIRLFYSVLRPHLHSGRSRLFLFANSEGHRLSRCASDWWEEGPFLNWKCLASSYWKQKLWSVESVSKCYRYVLEKERWGRSYHRDAGPCDKFETPVKHEGILSLCKPIKLRTCSLSDTKILDPLRHDSINTWELPANYFSWA